MPEIVLAARAVRQVFSQRAGMFKKSQLVAVDDVTFDVPRGSTTAIVGESGSGKSTLATILLGLRTPTSGDVLFEGKTIFRIPSRERFALRRKLQVVFQDPYGSLQPRMSVAESLLEVLQVHRIGTTREDRIQRIVDQLDQVGLGTEALNKYPHEFSGGQRQRIAIARSLIVEPSVLILDEPTSALDMSVQSQVLNLLTELQKTRRLTYLLITHNLDVVGYMADQVLVMERGKIVERGEVDKILDQPSAPATQKLLDSLLSVEPARRKLSG